MSTRPSHNAFLAAFSGVGWPLLGGAAASLLFYGLAQGPLNHPLMHRYFASHPVLYIVTVMFFVGLAALCFKGAELLSQSSMVDKIALQGPEGYWRPEHCPAALQSLADASPRMRGSLLARRLEESLQFVHRSRSANGLEDELKHLSDQEYDRQSQGYALANIVIWATPMLGFLGTVVGITQALGDLDPSQLATDPQTAMNGLLAGLYVAFDTTALALTLSMVLMFAKFPVERIQSQLLESVDQRAGALLIGRFEQMGGQDRDPYVAAVQQIGHSVLESTRQLVTSQAELWQQALKDSQGQSAELLEASRAALAQNLQTEARVLEESRTRQDQQHSEQLRHWSTLLQQQAQAIQQQQQELAGHHDRLAASLRVANQWHEHQPAVLRALSELTEAIREGQTARGMAPSPTTAPRTVRRSEGAKAA